MKIELVKTYAFLPKAQYEENSCFMHISSKRKEQTLEKYLPLLKNDTINIRIPLYLKW